MVGQLYGSVCLFQPFWGPCFFDLYSLEQGFLLGTSAGTERNRQQHYAISSPGLQWQEQLAVKAKAVQTRSLSH